MSVGSPQQDSTTAIAAGVSAAALLTGPGRLRKIICTAAGTASNSFFDDPGAPQGTLLFVTHVAPALGQVFDLNVPAPKGLWAAGIAGSAAHTVKPTTVS